MRPVRHFRPWRNVAARLGQIKVVEYDRGGARVRQTTEVREEAVALLQQFRVSLPKRFHVIEPAPATWSGSGKPSNTTVSAEVHLGSRRNTGNTCLAVGRLFKLGGGEV